MNEIMNFLEQYWGYTLFGGITFGTLLTTAIALIKMVLSNKLKNTQMSTLSDTVNTLLENLASKDEAYSALIIRMKSETTEHYARMKQQQEQFNKQQEQFNKQLESSNTYSQKVQAVTFTALSYIIMSSKLSDDTKLSLIAKFNTLLSEGSACVEELSDAVEDLNSQLNEWQSDLEVQTSSTPVTVEPITSPQEEVVQTVRSLFDKYSNKKGA